MAIDKIKLSSWASGARLSRVDITNLDKNIPYMLDSRSGQIATISSDTTFSGTSLFGKDDRSPFTIEDPGDISITDGEVQNGAEVVGTYTHGYEEVALPSSGNYELPTDPSVDSMYYKLTGNILGPVTLELPAIAGYLKIFDNQFVTYDSSDGYIEDGYTVSLIIFGGSSSVKLRSGSKVLVYCDASGIEEVASKGQHMELVDQVFVAANPKANKDPNPYKILPETQEPSYLGGWGLTGYVVGETQTEVVRGKYGLDQLYFSDLRTRGRAVFLDVLAGDKFEIDFACGVQRHPDSLSTETYIAPYVSYGEGWWSTPYDTFKEPKNKVNQILYSGGITALNGEYVHGSSKTVFTAPADGTYEFKLWMYYKVMTAPEYTFPVIGYGPVRFNVKQWRY